LVVENCVYQTWEFKILFFLEFASGKIMAFRLWRMVFAMLKLKSIRFRHGRRKKKVG